MKERLEMNHFAPREYGHGWRECGQEVSVVKKAVKEGMLSRREVGRYVRVGVRSGRECGQRRR